MDLTAFFAFFSIFGVYFILILTTFTGLLFGMFYQRRRTYKQLAHMSDEEMNEILEQYKGAL